MKKLFIIVVFYFISCCPCKTIEEDTDGRYVWLSPGETVIDSTARAECLLAMLEAETAKEVIKDIDEKGDRQRLLTKVKYIGIGYGIGTVSVLIYFIARGK